MSDILYRQTSPLPISFAVSKMSALSKLPRLNALVYHLLPSPAQQVVVHFSWKAGILSAKHELMALVAVKLACLIHFQCFVAISFGNRKGISVNRLFH